MFCKALAFCWDEGNINFLQILQGLSKPAVLTSFDIEVGELGGVLKNRLDRSHVYILSIFSNILISENFKKIYKVRNFNDMVCICTILMN